MPSALRSNLFGDDHVDSIYALSEGSLRVRWRLHEASDAWCIEGFRFLEPPLDLREIRKAELAKQARSRGSLELGSTRR